MDRGFEHRRRPGAFALVAAVVLACIGVAPTLGVVAPFATSTPSFARSFAGPTNYATGSGPESVAIGNMNGDRKPDLATTNELPNNIFVLVNTTRLCTVPNVLGKTLPGAKRTIARADCRVGKIRHAYSKIVKKGRVISEKPKPGTLLPNRGKVNLVVSRGRRPS